MHTFSARVACILCTAIIAACSAGPSGNFNSGTGGAGGEALGASSSNASSSSSSSASSSVSSSSGAGGGPAINSLSMLSLNLHCLRLDGTVYATNLERFSAIADFVANNDISVIAMQEVCDRPGENALTILQNALESKTSASWTSALTFAHIAWEGTADQANESVGLLVKGQLSNAKDIEHAVQGSLRRVAISAALPAEWSGLRITSVHFEVFEESARTMQARETAVAAMVDTDPGFSAIVAGDFNDIEGSATHAAFPAMGYIAADAGLDPVGIDHVMIHRATKLRPTHVEKVFLGNEAVSDHPGIFVRFADASGDAVVPTRIKANATVATNQFLSVRGSVLPLSWTLGYPMHKMASGQFSFVTTELKSDFEFKTLINDTTWQTGANAIGKVGMDHVVTPTF